MKFAWLTSIRRRLTDLSKRCKTAAPRRRCQLRQPYFVEALEGRVLLSVVTVSAQANIYGAGLTYAPGPGGGGGGLLPVAVNLSSMGNPAKLEFPSVSGSVSGWAAAGGYNGPDGGHAWGGVTNVPAWKGISGIYDGNSTMFMVGVFLGPNGQPATAPAALNVSNANNVASFTPIIGQQFFIGDGHTATHALQTFTVPQGATRLYLGFAEGYAFGKRNLPGYYNDNGGSLKVAIEGTDHAPVGTSSTITALENKSFTFTTANFGFTDPNDDPSDVLTAVRVTTLPSSGLIEDQGHAVTAGQFISVSDINSGYLTFVPTPNTTSAADTGFKFQVQDNGSTTNGSTNLDSTARTMTINVADQLVFLKAPPTTWTAGVSFGSSVIVEIVDGLNQVVTRDNSKVTLTIPDYPGWTALATAINGIATFVGLPSINAAGSHLIIASGPNDVSVSSKTTIIPAAASKLVFVNVPVTGKAATGISFKVQIEDAYGNLVTSDSSKVTVSIASGPAHGAFVTGAITTVKAVGGVATFSSLTFSKVGTYTLKVTDGALTIAVTGNIVLS